VTATRPISSILVGKRHRRDPGDVGPLAASIASIGLLQPVVITADGKLVDGQRRLEAFRKLRRTDVPVYVVDIDAIVRGELAANVYRKDFTPSELVAITEAVAERERNLAKARKVASLKRGDKKPVVETFHNGGKTRDKVAAPLGISGKTLDKATAIVKAAKAEPEKFNHLLEQMDKTGRVNGVYRRLKIAKQAEAIRAEPPPMPNRGPYRVAVADVPWPYFRDEDPSHRAARQYPTMTLEQIRALGPQIQNILHDDCIVWFWTTNFHMPVAFDLLKHWGFQHRTILTWAKDRMGTGDWLRSQTEHCILAIRGKPTVTLTNQATVLHAPARGHSVKPVEFYKLVEKLCPAPRYADIFSRYQHNDKWDCHGDEVGTLLGRASARGAT
jgi:N6-adenosine-specific RNA methylase IME4